MAVDPMPFLSPEKPEMWHGVEQRLGYWAAVQALVLSMVGTGIVAFPYGFRLCGGLASPLLVSMAYLAHLSYISLANCASRTGQNSYSGLLEGMSNGWQQYTKISLWLLLLFGATAYVLIVSNIIKAVFEGLGLGEDNLLLLKNPVLFFVILVVIYPFCLIRSFNDLAAVSTYCSVAMLIVVVLIICESHEVLVSSPPLPGNAATTMVNPSSVILALPIFGCAMFGHVNVSGIYAELEPALKVHMTSVSAVACGISAVIYAAVGATGYAAFGRIVGPDVVVQLAAERGERGWVIAIQALLASFIALKTPMTFLPLRNITSEMISPKLSNSDLTTTRIMLLTLALMVIVYLMALLFPHLNQVLELLGAFCVIPLTFIVPARVSWTIEEPRPRARCIILATTGVCTSLLSMVAVLVSLCG